MSELGLSGGTGPTSTQGNTITELINVTRWISNACTAIDTLWMDWKYLWLPYSVTGVAPVSSGYQYLTSPSQPVRLWDVNKLRFRPSNTPGALWQSVDYYERDRFFTLFDPDNATAGAPAGWTITPSNQVQFGSPFDTNYDFMAEFWQRSIALANDADVPMMPAEYHRIIMCRAAVYYGNREDAPEIIQGLEAEYVDLLDKLQSDQLEDYDIRRSSTDRKRRSARVSLSEFLR